MFAMANSSEKNKLKGERCKYGSEAALIILLGDATNIYCFVAKQIASFLQSFLDMIVAILLLAVSASAALLPIRTGISQLQMGNLAYAAYQLNYKTPLPDGIYNSVVSVSYVQNFNTANGVNVSSSCTGKTTTGMGCTVKSGNPNLYNVVYISYVSSDSGSLIVGSQSFTFSGPVSGKAYEIKPAIDSNYINTGNSLFVQIYPFVASISSTDGDFALSIDSSKFDSITLRINLTISVSAVDKPVTVEFGYMLFDGSAVTISLYEGQSLNPSSIPQGFIYGIKAVKTAAPAKRLLQISIKNITSTISNTLDKIPGLSPSDRAFFDQVIKQIEAIDAFNIFPLIEPHNSSTPIAGYLSTYYTPKKPSQTLSLLTAGPARVKELRFKNVCLNPFVFSALTQKEGFIDTDPQIYAALVKFGLFNCDNGFNKVSRRVKHSHKVEAGAAPAENTTGDIIAPPPDIALPATTPGGQTATGVDNNMFNNLFASNGFVIMTSATDIDQIYFYEVDPVQNLPSKSAPAPALLPPQPPLLLRSTVTNKQANPTCKTGEIKVGIETLVDAIQKKIVVGCCALKNYDRALKVCNNASASAASPALPPRRLLLSD